MPCKAFYNFLSGGLATLDFIYLRRKTKMAFGNMAKAASNKAKLQQIAQVMTNRTPYIIPMDKVTSVNGEDRMHVYSAQYGDVTILCWDQGNDFIIKTVSW